MYEAESRAKMNDAAATVVREKSFDEFHLYTLERPATLRDNETKQIEFVRTTGIQSQRLYVYDGAKIDQYGYYNSEQVRNDTGIRHGVEQEDLGFAGVQKFRHQSSWHRSTQGKAALLIGATPTAACSSSARTPSTTLPKMR